MLSSRIDQCVSIQTKQRVLDNMFMIMQATWHEIRVKTNCCSYKYCLVRHPLFKAAVHCTKTKFKLNSGMPSKYEGLSHVRSNICPSRVKATLYVFNGHDVWRNLWNMSHQTYNTQHPCTCRYVMLFTGESVANLAENHVSMPSAPCLQQVAET